MSGRMSTSPVQSITRRACTRSPPYVTSKASFCPVIVVTGVSCTATDG
jgi:hypothetical protein